MNFHFKSIFALSSFHNVASKYEKIIVQAAIKQRKTERKKKQIVIMIDVQSVE